MSGREAGLDFHAFYFLKTATQRSNGWNISAGVSISSS